jgi:small subunit ribosomal protein S1
MVTEGVIKNLTEYGAFIDLGGLDGLLHITDMSWGRLKHPNEIFKVNDKIKVKVLKYDEDKERVSLGHKQLLPDPWESVDQKFKIGDKVKGKVISLTDYGAFIELQSGIEGLIHVSEMSWTQRVKHPSKILNESDVVEAIVLDIDHPNRRISLGMKQIEPNPWDLIAEKYPVGSKITGSIKNTTDFGIFVGVPEGVDGLIHISDISWDSKPIDPNSFKKGDELECIVLSIDKAAEKFSLGIKQLSDDPWKAVVAKYSFGTKVTGKVTKIADFGIFLEIEPGIEGLLHISELFGEEKPKDRIKNLKEGTELEVMVTSVDLKEHKLSLSEKAMHKAEERENMRHYAKQTSGSSKTSLGDVLESAMAQKLKDAAAKKEDKE